MGKSFCAQRRCLEIWFPGIFKNESFFAASKQGLRIEFL
jgi:hypothetical protein